MNRNLIVVVSLLLLSACASVPELRGKTESDGSLGVLTPMPDGLPNTEIDPAVMYMLLVAEIAGQREQYDIALEGYLEVAKLVNDAQVAERAAKIALYVRDAEKAGQAAELWLKQDESNETARKIALLAALKTERVDAALTHAEVLLGKDEEGFQNTVLELAQALGADVNIAVVYEMLSGLAASHSENASLPYMQALFALRLDSDVLALQSIERALAIRPGWDKALLLKAQLLLQAGDLQEADALLSLLDERNPDDLGVKKLLAQVTLKRADYGRAQKLYQQMLADNDQDDQARFALALVNLQLGQIDDAQAQLTVLSRQPQWRDRAYFYLAQIALQDEDHERALSFFDRVQGDQDLAFTARIAAASLLIKNAQWSSAWSRIEAVQAVETAHRVRLVLLKAEFHEAQKQYQQAFEQLTEGLVALPGQLELLYARALVAERMGSLAQVEQDLTQLLAQEPDNASALNALGYSLVVHSERYDEAAQLLEKALALRPDEAVILDSYGWLQFKLGRLEQALTYLEKAYAMLQETEIAAHLAEVKWRLGQKDSARMLLHPLLKAHPDDDYLQDVLERLPGLRP
ncbi:MAG: tetratricopeptide repeat protein [Methylococcales bacterium]|nr:tetratricopeptide repeat protein [Methylococcales bacterium]